MKTFTALFTAMAGLVSFATAENICSIGNTGGASDPHRTFWVDAAVPSGDITRVCSDLIQFRKDKGTCNKFETYPGTCSENDGSLRWSFATDTKEDCTAEDIHEIWTAATNNAYGIIQCA
jgi:hypothetical protein